MTDLIFSSSEVFGKNFRERRLSKRAKKAMVNELVLPEDSYEMTYEDECITSGGVNLITIPKEICASIAGSVFAGGVIAGVLKHTKLFTILPCTTIALVAVGAYLGDKFMNAMTSGKDVTISVSWWNALKGGIIGLVAGVCFGWMTANIKVGVDAGLAAFIGSNYNTLKFKY